MADKTRIEWTDATWNPVRGCTRVSAGCQHCYAEQVAARFSGPGQPYEGLIHPSTGGWNGKVRLVPEALDQPGRWRKPRRIFVSSMSDLFHEAVPDEFIDRVFTEMRDASQHTFQVLTKRPERMLAYLSRFKASPPRDGYITRDGVYAGARGSGEFLGFPDNWPLRNVWLGVSVEDQAAADERIPLLLQCPAAVRWISAEPLLGRVDLCEHLGMWWNSTMQCFESTGTQINRHSDGRSRIGWVVAGGESGPGARPMHPDWARSLRDQCAAAGVPFLFKQWGSYHLATIDEHGDVEPPMPLSGDFRRLQVATRGSRRFLPVAGDADVGSVFTPGNVLALPARKSEAGRLLDDVLHDAYPEARP